MSDDSTRIPEVQEKKCPKCGSEVIAWVSTDDGKDTFECRNRKCKVVFSYQGDW
jgi:ssDNA-binding Zn-finger/Zn-ribbon topoisomerase 1